MSYCEICNRYSEDLHPVSFRPVVNGKPIPEEIREFVDWEGVGMWDDMEIALHEDYTPYICEDCFRKYYHWIIWWG